MQIKLLKINIEAVGREWRQIEYVKFWSCAYRPYVNSRFGVIVSPTSVCIELQDHASLKSNRPACGPTMWNNHFGHPTNSTWTPFLGLYEIDGYEHANQDLFSCFSSFLLLQRCHVCVFHGTACSIRCCDFPKSYSFKHLRDVVRTASNKRKASNINRSNTTTY